MKQIRFVISVFTVFILASCGNSVQQPLEKAVKAPLTETEQRMQLTADDLFAGDKIRLYLRKDTLQGSESNRMFLKALDAYKNKKDLKVAEERFIQSILRYPTAKAYYELGNVYLDAKNYDKALQAYRMAEHLNYEPFSKLLYNMACVYSCMEESDQAANYLEYAIEAGYLNVDNIQKDPDLAFLREEDSYIFRSHLRKALNGVSDADKIYYLQFKKRFPMVKLPLSIKNVVSDTYFEMNNAITYDFEKFIPEMRDEKFSREVSKGFYYFANIGETANYTAVVYIIRDEFLGEQAPLTYKLVTFNNEGKIIDKLVIAGREDFSEELRACSINANKEITVDLFETTFEKDPETEGYYDNPVVSKSKVGTEKFRIHPSGKIIIVNRLV